MEASAIQARLRDAGIDGELDTDGHDATLTVGAEALLATLTTLRDDDACGMEMLHNVTAVQREQAMELYYHVCSYRHHHALVVRVVLPAPEDADDWQPEVASVASVYASADWHEREQWDLLGVRFAGHPDHRRILLPEEWIGHPLRKDYVYPTEHGGMPLELDSIPIYERDDAAPTKPSGDATRAAGAPLDQGASNYSTRPHAGGKAPASEDKGDG